jgi:hypothetical protein
MKRSKTIDWIAGLLLMAIWACNNKMTTEEIETIGAIPCQAIPAYVKTSGLNPSRSAFSTSEKKIMGLVLVQIPENPADTANRKTWQHPGWKSFGWMGPITTDDKGNVYTAPVPVINLLHNPVEKQNTIYKVNNVTAEMTPLATLPRKDSISPENAYGILGLYYDCHAGKLYASSVAGSTRSAERGVIYLVDPETGTIEDQLGGMDVVGLCTGGITGTKRLYFGSSRTPDIYSIELKKGGAFTGKSQKECSLDLLGPRGDDKARRIRFDRNGDMLVYGVEFNYNLTAPTEKQETLYRFRYQPDEKKWINIPTSPF